MKFSAFTVRTVSRMVSGTPRSGPRMSVPMSATGRKTNASWTPSSTMTPAAAIWPVSLVSASRPNLSSSTPSRQISPPATSTAAVCESSKVRCRAGSRVATRMAAATPRYIATPPPRGVGMTCTSRSRGAAIIRQRIATIRTTGVARKVTRPAVSRTTAYSRMVRSDGARGLGVGGVSADQLAHRGADLGAATAVGVADRRPDEARDLLHVRLGHALGGDRRAADPDAGGDRGRLRVERDRVLVEHDAGRAAAGLRVGAGHAGLPQVEQRQVGVGAAGDRAQPLGGEAVGEGLGVGHDLPGVGLVLRLQAILEVDRLGGDRVHERAALHHRERGLVEGLGVLGLADERAAT